MKTELVDFRSKIEDGNNYLFSDCGPYRYKLLYMRKFSEL